MTKTTNNARYAWVSWTATALLLAAAVEWLLYFVFGPSLSTLHADCTDSLLWAHATVQTGEVLTEEFSYAALLPFGSSLWMVPVLHLFGYTLAAQQVSMAIFAILFVAAVFWLFRCLGRRPYEAAFGAFCTAFLLSGSEKLREIMWEHTIYYSLSILLFTVVAALTLTLQKRLAADCQNKAVTVIFAVLLAAVCAGCATDGMQILALTVAPIAAGVILLVVLDKRPFRQQPLMKQGITVGSMMLGAVVGLLLLAWFTKGGKIIAGYENAYTAWSPMEKWGENASHFWMQYLSLFGVVIEESAPLISLGSVGSLCRMVTAAGVLVCPVVMFIRYRRLTEGTKLLLWGHTVVSAVVTFGFVCGYLSAANWRLTPMLGTAILVTLAYLMELFSSGTVAKRLAVLAASLFALVSVLNAVAILQLPTDARVRNPHIEIAETLCEKGYTHGYATFWNAPNTMLLSDERLTVATVAIENNGVHRRDYQTLHRWYDEIAAQETVFLLMSMGEYDTLTSGGAWEQLTAQSELIELIECREYYIAAFKGRIL